MASITLKEIGKFFGRHRVLEDIALDIQDREFIVLLGPSGCGKTTLLNIIAGLERQTTGNVFIDGANVDDRTPGERDIGFVFQSYALYPNKTVYENLAFSLKFKQADALEFEEHRNGTGRTSKKEMVDKRVREIARILQIEGNLNAKPGQLSGGQRQRVAMGRAMVRRPKAYLFDEPLSNLDAILRVSMREEIKEIHRKVSTTVVYVTHDQVEAMTLADRIVVINEGRILQVGTPRDIYDCPANVFVARFVGIPSMNIFETTIVEDQGRLGFSLDGTVVPLPARRQEHFGLFVGKRIMLGLRSEHFALEDRFSASGRIRVTMVDQEFLGDKLLVHVRAGNTRLVMSSDHPLPVMQGDNIDLFLDLSRLHTFDAATKRRLDR